MRVTGEVMFIDCFVFYLLGCVWVIGVFSYRKIRRMEGVQDG